nr:MAG TPA: hypothetical protein [Caudoviricetes sp.]
MHSSPASLPRCIFWPCSPLLSFHHIKKFFSCFFILKNTIYFYLFSSFA